MGNDSQATDGPYSVYCLCIDMIGSTKAGLELPSRQYDKFNRALVEQIKPHWEALDLTGGLLKFTGDGWRLMTNDPGKVPALCCLAMIMARGFQDEMSERTSIPAERIPPLRLAVCAGRDIRVELPDGRQDWVGDSVRRAVRAAGYCFANEIIIDTPVKYVVLRDFAITDVDVEGRTKEGKPVKAEEKLDLHVLGDLKTEAATDSEAPEYYVYALEVMGKGEEAGRMTKEVSERLEDEAGQLQGLEEEGKLRDILRSWNRLMARVGSYSRVIEILNGIREAGVAPDVVTYNILMNKAQEYDEAKMWFKRMVEEGIEPDVVTYTTLVKGASDYDVQKMWFDRMVEEGIEPNVVTYWMLIGRSPNFDEAKRWAAMVAAGGRLGSVAYNRAIEKCRDYREAKSWLEEISQTGVRLSIGTYNSMINKAADHEEAKTWLEKMRRAGVKPNIRSYNAILQTKGCTSDEAKACIEEMRSDGICPDGGTYNIVMERAGTCEEAGEWIKEMQEKGLGRDAGTYNAVIGKAGNFDEGKEWLDRMREEGIRPNVNTYCVLFTRDLGGKSASELLEWYLGEEYHPEEALEAAMGNYERGGRTGEALYLARAYPHLPAAGRIIREYAERDI